MPEQGLSITELSHAYGATPVLEPVSLSVEPGQLLAVLGPSGCGKTTLLRALAGLITPSSGRIRLGGRDLCEGGRELVPTEERRVGLVFQSYALFGHLSVAENVGFGLRPRDPARVADLLERVGLAEFAERDPRSLSGGQQQRVALARAMAPRPDLLLLDEPFANADAELRVRLGVELRELLAQEQTPAILVTHDREDALRTADQVAAFCPGPRGGRLAQLGSPEDVYLRPSEPSVAELTGRASWIRGVGEGLRAETPFGTLELLEARSGPVQVLLRPEQVEVEPGDGAAQVSSSAFMGAGYLVQLRLGEVEAWGSSPRPLSPGPARAHLRGPCWALPAQSAAHQPTKDATP